MATRPFGRPSIDPTSPGTYLRFRLTGAQKQAIEALSENQHVSKAAVVRRALDYFLFGTALDRLTNSRLEDPIATTSSVTP